MYLGIEIGGTKLQVGLGGGQGSLEGLLRDTVTVSAGAAGIRATLEHLVPTLLRRHGLSVADLQRIGIGFGGPVDDATRTTLKSHQICGWDHFPLAAWAEATWGVPTVLGNDADVAGLAEALFGAGQGLSPVFYVTVGSGIGGALILDGQIVRGTGRGAGEIGHLWVDYDLDAPSLTPHSDAGWANVEDRASGWGLARAAGVPDVPTLAQRIAAGDASAAATLERGRRRLALGLSHVIALCCPRRIVIGGGVALLDARLFLDPLRTELAALAFPPFAGCWDVQPARLGEAVVVQGALALAARGHACRAGVAAG